MTFVMGYILCVLYLKLKSLTLKQILRIHFPLCIFMSAPPCLVNALIFRTPCSQWNTNQSRGNSFIAEAPLEPQQTFSNSLPCLGASPHGESVDLYGENWWNSPLACPMMLF